MKKDKIKKLKKGECFPIISYDDALALHEIKIYNGNYNDYSHLVCHHPYIIKKPLYRFEKHGFFIYKQYSQFKWECLSCGWKSEIITTRTI